ncbi:hypothetical protein [Clostridium sp.]|uniref:hypothetical protein n=1 Tax=Clostridium sp. TaxID=1506 RepID=UPI003D6D7E24
MSMSIKDITASVRARLAIIAKRNKEVSIQYYCYTCKKEYYIDCLFQSIVSDLY